VQGFDWNDFFKLGKIAEAREQELAERQEDDPDYRYDSKWSRLFEPTPESGGYFGGRDNTLYRLCWYLRAKRIPFNIAHQLVFLWNEMYCQPPIDNFTVETKIRFMYNNVSFTCDWPKFKDLTDDE
jgi:hypothetical protein